MKKRNKDTGMDTWKSSPSAGRWRCFGEGKGTGHGFPCFYTSPDVQCLGGLVAPLLSPPDLTCLSIWTVEGEFSWLCCLYKQHVTAINSFRPFSSKLDFIISPTFLTSFHSAKT